MSTKQIPQKIRQEVWESQFNDNPNGQCYCCGISIELNRSWDCGHIKSRCHGGPTILENLRPICCACNREMNAQHMFEYIIKYNLQHGLEKISSAVDFPRYSELVRLTVDAINQIEAANLENLPSKESLIKGVKSKRLTIEKRLENIRKLPTRLEQSKQLKPSRQLNRSRQLKRLIKDPQEKANWSSEVKRDCINTIYQLLNIHNQLNQATIINNMQLKAHIGTFRLLYSRFKSVFSLKNKLPETWYNVLELINSIFMRFNGYTFVRVQLNRQIRANRPNELHEFILTTNMNQHETTD